MCLLLQQKELARKLQNRSHSPTPVMPTAPLDSGQASYLTPVSRLWTPEKGGFYEYPPTAEINRDCRHRV